MGKMVIDRYILFIKKFPTTPLYYLKHFIYFISYITTIPFYIFDNTLILLIRPLNTTVRQLNNQSYRINLNRRILTYRSFSITHESFFNPSYMSYSHDQVIMQFHGHIPIYNKSMDLLDGSSSLLVRNVVPTLTSNKRQGLSLNGPCQAIRNRVLS
jgi:hypothetical protein